MSVLKGGCLCGEVQYQINAEPDPNLQFTCHCRDCQQVTGTGHARSMGVAEEHVEWTGKAKTFELTSAAGNKVDTGFCENCGAPLFKKAIMMPGMVFFHVGSLDLASSQRWQSKQTAFPESRQCWDTLD